MKRIITSLILGPLLLFLIFYAQPWLWFELIVLLTVLAAREYWSLIPARTLLSRAFFLTLLVVSLWGCALVFPYWQSVGLMLWVLICFALITFPNSQEYWGYSGVVSIVILVLWPLFIQSLSHIYFLDQGKALIIYVLFLVWAADSGAYFVGKYGGRHKLIPQVSPGKTWEGVLGGFIVALIVVIIGYLYFMPSSLYRWCVIALGTLMSSVVGDLCMSLLKRRCQVKDTGTIIPGHGGILDRLDSLIAAAPVFYFGLMSLIKV